MAFQLKAKKRYKVISINKSKCSNLPCGLCGTVEAKLITVSNGFNLVECKNCGFIYINPRPPKEILRNFYKEYFSEESDDIDAWRREFQSLYLQIKDEINKMCEAKGRILDIGCSFGFFLDLMRKDGWEVFGLDYSKTAVDYATNVLKLPNIIYGGIDTGLAYLASVGIRIKPIITDHDLTLVWNMRSDSGDEFQIIHPLHFVSLFPVLIRDLASLL